jgi:protein-disulfide isomerase
MDVAAALAFTVTPSFMIGGAGVIGYPGPKTMARMVASVRKCELIACG